MCSEQRLRWTALLGAILIMSAVGTVTTFGNMNPYVTSYLRVVLNDTSMEYSKTTWVKSFSAIGQAVAMPLSGYLEQRLGVRLAVLIGCFTFSSSVLASGFSLQYSFTAFLFTYGFLFGIGIGITYPLCIACSIRWFPRRKGTISGVTMIGFGLSSVAFGIVETLLVNPSNLSPSTQGAGDVAHQKFFTQPELLDRVPRCFMILAAIYSVMFAIGVPLISSPKRQSDQVVLIDSSEDSEQLSSTSDACSSTKNDLEAEANVKLRDVLRSRHFYMLYFIFFSNFLTLNCMSLYFKAFGQTFVANDFFLTVIGSLASVFATSGRVFWGFFADRLSNRCALLAICCLSSALLFSLYSCILLPQFFYLIWVCSIYFSFAGQFAVCPAAIAQLYGSKYFATNYGCLHTASVIASITIGLIATALLQTIGWFGMFLVPAILDTIAALVAFFLRAAKSPQGLSV